jgi:hypothetical protein
MEQTGQSSVEQAQPCQFHRKAATDWIASYDPRDLASAIRSSPLFLHHRSSVNLQPTYHKHVEIPGCRYSTELWFMEAVGVAEILRVLCAQEVCMPSQVADITAGQSCDSCKAELEPLWWTRRQLDCKRS